MKLTVDAKALRDAVGKSIAPQTSPDETICHVHLKAWESGRVDMTSTDGWRMLTLVCADEIDEAGTATCRPGLLKSALNGLEGPVTVTGEKDGGGIQLEHSDEKTSRRFRLGGVDPEQFPKLDEQEEARCVLHTADEIGRLAAGLSRVAYACGRGDARPYLNGVYLDPDGAVVATDGHRIAYQERVWPTDAPGVIVPHGALAQVIDWLRSNGGATVHLIYPKAGYDTPSALEVFTPDGTFRTKLIESRFPDWRRLVVHADQAESKVSMDVDEAIAAVARVRPFYPYHGGELRMDDGESAIRLSRRGIDVEDAFPATGDPGFRCMLCLDYLAQALSHGKGGRATCFTVDPKRPIGIRFEGSDDDLHMIMPMAI